MAGGRLLILAAFVFAVRTDAQQPSSQATHTLKATPKTIAWGYYDASTPPVRDIYDQVKDKGPGGHILTGPIYVEDAQPGDVLEVRIVAVRLAIPYAYNGFGPGRGFLPEDY